MSKFNYSNYVSKTTSQRSPILGREKEMIRNNAGGYGFKVDEWDVLKRFILLGTEGGTFYVGEIELTEQACKQCVSLIKENGKKVVDVILELSPSGRAPKNETSVFLLALCFKYGNNDCKEHAKNNFNKIIRTGTDLFQFVSIIKKCRGFGRSLRSAISNWYKQPKIEYQVCKYQSRKGWKHQDIFRLAHIKPSSEKNEELFRWLCNKVNYKELDKPNKLVFPWVINRLSKISHDNTYNEKEKDEYVIKVIDEYNPTWEMIPRELYSKKIWEHLLPNMNFKALCRYLSLFSSNGVFSSNENIDIACSILENEQKIKGSLIHPIVLLNTLKCYTLGRGEKLSWSVIPEIRDSLNVAFQKSFYSIEPMNKKILIGLDVSGSMDINDCFGFKNLNCRETSAALSLFWKKTEKRNCYIKGFSDKFIDLSISQNDNLEYVLKTISDLPFGGTDCAIPIQYAISNNLFVDSFICITDNETWRGKREHVVESLNRYRNLINNKAKFLVMSMAYSAHSIADPKDKGMLDTVGIDASVPKIASDFILN